ncbi:protein POLLEN DEFECTIVE IN GUIDANCE 1-like isoform X3 [Cicer arietinum]|uniref:protein POLLEN DEFECTIVE IN GUIDANCE 1-like isoform X3 n=1 Tax=Cicer arietinum TaxID=3827 RepID=UPI003CC5208F
MDSAVTDVDDGCKKEVSSVTSVGVVTSETMEPLKVKHNLTEESILKKSPLTYFLEKLYNENSLWSTTTVGNEKGRERVYDTIFRLPWRCELLIDVGFFVCFNSFLSLFTVVPTRVVMTSWKLLKTRKFKRPSTIELSDLGCFVIMACGVTVLQQIDISLIYHIIRGQATIKLYVIYNVLEIFDKICQSFNGDVLQMLFHSAEGLARCPPEMPSMRFWIWRFISDQVLAVVATNILFFRTILPPVPYIRRRKKINKAKLRQSLYQPALLLTTMHCQLCWYRIIFLRSKAMCLRDTIRIMFTVWCTLDMLLVYLCEVAIDIIKHSFIAKFNNITPIAYSEFLEDLCKQTLHMQTEDVKKNLKFVPLAPACVVIRVLAPVYAANLPCSLLLWQFFWIILFSAITYILLTSLKILIGLVLKKHATWYVNRCQRRKHHLHPD